MFILFHNSIYTTIANSHLQIQVLPEFSHAHKQQYKTMHAIKTK